jgi:hypothetical protein
MLPVVVKVMSTSTSQHWHEPHGFTAWCLLHGDLESWLQVADNTWVLQWCNMWAAANQQYFSCCTPH